MHTSNYMPVPSSPSLYPPPSLSTGTGTTKSVQSTLRRTVILNLARRPFPHRANPTLIFYFTLRIAFTRTSGSQDTESQSYQEVSGRNLLESRYGAPVLSSSSSMRADLETVSTLRDKGARNDVVTILVLRSRTTRMPPLVPEPIMALPP